MAPGCVGDLLHARDKRAKAGNDDATLASLKTWSKAGAMTRSDGVQPGLSALVESASRASTPRPRISAAWRNRWPVVTGVWSNL